MAYQTGVQLPAAVKEFLKTGQPAALNNGSRYRFRMQKAQDLVPDQSKQEEKGKKWYRLVAEFIPVEVLTGPDQPAKLLSTLTQYKRFNLLNEHGNRVGFSEAELRTFVDAVNPNGKGDLRDRLFEAAKHGIMFDADYGQDRNGFNTYTGITSPDDDAGGEASESDEKTEAPADDENHLTESLLSSYDVEQLIGLLNDASVKIPFKAKKDRDALEALVREHYEVTDDGEAGAAGGDGDGDFDAMDKKALLTWAEANDAMGDLKESIGKNPKFASEDDLREAIKDLVG